MVGRLPLFFLPIVFFAGLGCQQRHKDVVQAQTANWIEVAGVLREVKDAPSMDEAERKMVRLASKFKDVSRQAKSLPQPGPNVLAELEEDSRKMQSAMQETMKEIERIKGLPGGPEFFERFTDMLGGPTRVNR